VEDVLVRGSEVVIVFERPGGEAVAEEVAAAVVPAVERLRVDAVQALHSDRQAPELGLDDKVVVVRHQAEDVDAPVLALDHVREETQKQAALVVVEEDRGARDSSRGDVVDAFRRKVLPRSPHPVDASSPRCLATPAATSRLVGC
jgi:hypothetical protein